MRVKEKTKKTRILRSGFRVQGFILKRRYELRRRRSYKPERVGGGSGQIQWPPMTILGWAKGGAGVLLQNEQVHISSNAVMR